MHSFLAFLSFFFVSQTSWFMPQNDLHLQDTLETVSGISEDEFNEVIRVGREAYAESAKANNEILVINAKWTDKTVNANACRGCEPGKVIVNMFGGLARRREITVEGFALVLCHELSHLYGGTPYISPEYRMAAEGQSDYMATKECFRKIYPMSSILRVKWSEYEPFIEKNCGAEDFRCKNSLVGGKSLGNLLGFMSGADSLPAFETPDTSKVLKTNLSYPRTVQCRLDTYRAGTFNEDRPSCWYKQGSIRDLWNW